jgi:hypothetical protein
LAVVHHTFTHKQYTEYRERNIHNNPKHWNTHITINKFKTNLGIAGQVVPRLCELYPGLALQLRKMHGINSVRVAARTSKADTVQYKNNEQYNIQKKNSNALRKGCANLNIIHILVWSACINLVKPKTYFMYHQL